MDAPFRTTSAPPTEQAQFYHKQFAWRNQTQMQMGGVAPQQQPPPQGMPGPIPGGAQLNPGPGGGAVASGMKGGPQQGQVPSPGSQQQVCTACRAMCVCVVRVFGVVVRFVVFVCVCVLGVAGLVCVLCRRAVYDVSGHFFRTPERGRT